MGLFSSKEDREYKARMEFIKNKRAFTRYYQELDTSIKSFTKMARDAELSGNHENAKSCAVFVLKLQRTQTKVQGLLQRFEMMYSMQRLTGVMTTFVKACGKMGIDMNKSIDLKDLWKSTGKIDSALGKLDEMSDQMNMVFDTIDQGMGAEYNNDKDELDAQAEGLLDGIMGRHNTVNYPSEEQANAQPSLEQTRAMTGDPGALAQAEDEADKMLNDMLKMRGR